VTGSVPYNDALLDIALTPDGTRMLLAGLRDLTVVPIVVQQ
jgi:hypothetical protein